LTREANFASSSKGLGFRAVYRMKKRAIWALGLTPQEINERAANTLSDYLGIRFTEVGDDFLSAVMPIDQKTIQPMGIMHGGASAALAETVASAAANYCIDQNAQIAVGLDLNINHLRAVKSGFVKAIARPFHLGQTTQVWEIKIFNKEEALVSIARLTVAVIAKKSPHPKG